MNRLSIIDYGMGNIGSLTNMIARAGGQAEIVSSPESVHASAKLVLPGIGAFDNAMRRIEDLGLRGALDKKVQEEKTPILCICLGAQLITLQSEEGELPGLGWVQGRVKRFNSTEGLRIPHMGWNDVEVKKTSRLFRGMEADASFYFVHSYFIELDDPADVLTTTRYGIDFVSSIEHDNIFATQYHPEKSHRYGLQLIRNFVEL